MRCHSLRGGTLDRQFPTCRIDIGAEVALAGKTANPKSNRRIN
jgi:hypothetical protein